jgi:hypothetical protein
MATIWQEVDGSGSMRRTLSMLYALICFEQQQLAVLFDSKWAFFGAVLNACMVLILMGMTTVESLVKLAKVVKGVKYVEKDNN